MSLCGLIQTGYCAGNLLIRNHVKSENYFLGDDFEDIFSSGLKHGSVLNSVSVKCCREVLCSLFPDFCFRCA